MSDSTEREPLESDWIQAELEALEGIDGGPSVEDQAWLGELLPALREAGRDADAVAAPSPDAIADAVLAEAGQAHQARSLSWADGVLLAASLLIAGGLMIQSRPDVRRIALQPSPRREASPPPAPASSKLSPAATSSAEPEPSRATPRPEADPTPPGEGLEPQGTPPPAATSPTPGREGSAEPSPGAPLPTLTPPRPQPRLTPQPTQIRVGSRAAVVARVARLRGRSRVRRGGRWVQLAAGDVLRRGEDLQVQRGSLQLGLEEGGRAILGSKAKLALGSDWKLEAGVCAFSGRSPGLVAGGLRLSGAAASEWVVACHGSRTELEVLAGHVELSGGAEPRRLGPGQGADLRLGRVGVPRAAGRSPQWLREARIPLGHPLLEEPCLPTSLARYSVLLGEPERSGLQARPKSKSDELAISLGYGQPSGLCRYQAKARLFLRAWLERDAPLTVQIETPDRSLAWRLTRTLGAGALTLDVPLSELVPVSGKALAPGQALDFLSLQAGLPAERVGLRLEHVQIYLP